MLQLPAFGTRRKLQASPSLLLGAAGFFGNMSWQVVLPVLPLHLSHLGFTPAQIGVLISTLSATMGVVELLAGMIVAVLGRRWSMIAGFGVNAIFLIVAALVYCHAMVAASLAAIGAAKGILVPPLHATVADSTAPTTRGHAIGLFWFCASLAALAGPVIGGLVAAQHGDRAPFLLGAAFSLLALPILTTRLVPGRASTGTSLIGAKELLRDAAILRFCLSTMFCYALTGVWMTFLPLHVARQGISVVIIGWIFTVQGGLYAFMQIPTGRLVSRERGRWLASAGIAAMGATILLTPLIHTPLLFIVAGGIYGLGFGLIPVTFATLITWEAPAEKYTTAMSVYNSAIDFGLFIGPFLGALAALINGLGPFILAIPLALGAATVSLLHGRASPIRTL